MKQLKRYYFIIILILVFVAFISLFFLSDNTSKMISVASNYIGAVSSLITLIIALLLFDKYGLKKNIKEKQTERIFQIINEARKIRLEIKNKDATLYFSPFSPHHDRLEEYYSKKLIFSNRYWLELQTFFDIAKDIFTPKNIGEKINIIEPYTLELIDCNR